MLITHHLHGRETAQKGEHPANGGLCNSMKLKDLDSAIVYLFLALYYVKLTRLTVKEPAL